MSPFVSVLLPTRNRSRYLTFAIQSVLAQSFQDWELIISDNNSSDDTPHLLANIADQRIRVHRVNTDLSTAENWSEAYQFAAGQYVVLMGDDDYLMPNCLEQYSRVTTTHPGTDMLYSRESRYVYPDALFPTWTKANTNVLIIPHRYSGEVKLVSSRLFLEEIFSFRSFRCHFTCIWIKRQLLDDISVNGTPFLPPFQDYYTIPAALLKSKQVAEIDAPLVLVGVSAAALGMLASVADGNTRTASWKNHPLVPDIEVPIPGPFFANGYWQALQQVCRHAEVGSLEPGLEGYLRFLVRELVRAQKAGLEVAQPFLAISQFVHDLPASAQLRLHQTRVFQALLVSLPEWLFGSLRYVRRLAGGGKTVRSNRWANGEGSIQAAARELQQIYGDLTITS